MDISAIIAPIISAINSSRIQAVLFPIKLIFIGFTAFFLGALIYYISRTEWVKEVILYDFVQFFFKRPYGIKKVARRWEAMKKGLTVGTEPEWKLAVMEADDLLDDILAKMGYTGEGLSDRLKKVPADVLPSIDSVRQAHKVRDNIVHDPDYRLTLEEARSALEGYDKAFQELEAF